MNEPKYINEMDLRREIRALPDYGELWRTAMKRFLDCIDEVRPADVVEVVRCCKCGYWDRETLQHQANDFRDWNEAECKILAERDPYYETDHYTEADDYCSYGERKDG